MFQEEKAFEKLSSAVRRGWAKRHPLSNEQRAKVREMVIRQLEEDKNLTREQRQRKAQRRMRELILGKPDDSPEIRLCLERIRR